MFKTMISVIMLTYNRETMVKRAIECVLNQTLKNFEFIIVNNGSTDRSGVIADEYAMKDNRIKVIHRERGNIGSGRNTGLGVAIGDYITFIDDDDWCELDFLEFLYSLAIENDAEVSICGANASFLPHANEFYNEKLIMTAEEALLALFERKRYNTAFPTKMFTNKLGNKVRFSETDKYDDIAQMYKLLSYANKIVYSGFPKYTFHRHDSNNSAWITAHELLDPNTLSEYLKAYQIRTDWLSEHFPKQINTWQYYKWSFMISMVEKIKRNKLENFDNHLRDMTNELTIQKYNFLSSPLIRDFEITWMNTYIRK